MAATFTHPVLSVHAAPATSLVSRALFGAAVAVANWEMRFKTRQELKEMTPEMLYDIGLTRAEALNEAEKPFWQA